MFCLTIINSLGIKSCDSSFNDFKLNQHQNTSGEVEKLVPTNKKIGGREETTEEAMYMTHLKIQEDLLFEIYWISRSNLTFQSSFPDRFQKFCLHCQ